MADGHPKIAIVGTREISKDVAQELFDSARYSGHNLDIILRTEIPKEIELAEDYASSALIWIPYEDTNVVEQYNFLKEYKETNPEGIAVLMSWTKDLETKYKEFADMHYDLNSGDYEKVLDDLESKIE